MILIVTNKTDYTADYLILKLKKQRIHFFRLNTEDFPNNIEINIHLSNNLLEGDIRCYDRTININEIKSVWYRRPKEPFSGNKIKESTHNYIIRESKATLIGLWKILNCKWISHPENITKAESKLFQLKTASKLGFTIPDTLVTNSPQIAKNFLNKYESLAFKTQKQSHINYNDTEHCILTNKVTREHINNFSNIRISPVLFQPYIEKKTEIRVTVVDNEVFTAELHSQETKEAKIDWRKSEMKNLKHTPHNLPVELEKKCILLVKRLGLLFGAIDFILTPNGEYVFLEINPNGQWAWIEEICPQLKISDSIISCLCR